MMVFMALMIAANAVVASKGNTDECRLGVTLCGHSVELFNLRNEHSSQSEGLCEQEALAIWKGPERSVDRVEPIGVFEASDKVGGLLRQGYLEINISEAKVPDFSQTFTRGKEYTFNILPSDFMKKPSQAFAGKTATGFLKYRSKAFIANTEVLMLTSPEAIDGGYRLKWESDLGKSGSCELRAESDSVVWFICLGTFPSNLGPDSLRFVLQKVPTAGKPYLAYTPAPPVVKPEVVEEGKTAVARSSSSDTIATEGRPLFEPSVDAAGNIQVPPTNNVALSGKWLGVNGMRIRLNSKSMTYEYYGKRYYGMIEMDGPGYVKEGIVAIRQQSPRCIGLYSQPLDTDHPLVHYSELRLPADGNGISYHLCGSVEVRTQMFKLVSRTASYRLWPFLTQFYGLYSTGKEVEPFPLNFYFKQLYDFQGEMKEGYGLLPVSYNGGSYLDEDLILEAKIQDDGSVRVKYLCSRSESEYSALLVWNKAAKSWSITQVKPLSGDEDDCFLLNAPPVSFVGDMK